MVKFSCKIICIPLMALWTGHSFALPTVGAKKLTSPNHEYTLQIVDTKEPGEYKLKIIRRGVELAQYPFEGELISAYWSPSLTFVAVDNHDGHAGFWPWIISLADGSIITSHGIVQDQNYDRYADVDDFPDLRQAARTALMRVYPQADDDQLRNGYTSVAYGWKDDHHLLMFHDFPYDYLSVRKNRTIQAYSIWNVTDRSIVLKSIVFKKVKEMPDEPMPREVYRTLNFMN